MLAPYRGVLARPGALGFCAAGVVARLPISMVGIGIVLAVSSIYDSYALAGRVSAVYIVISSVTAPTIGKLVDRYGQARVMAPTVVVTGVGLVGLVVALVTEAPEWVLYAAAVVAGVTGQFGSLTRARWSHLLRGEPDALHTAYSLEAALDEVVFIVGPATATLLATGVAPTAGIVVPLVALAIGATWFLGQRATQPPPVRPAAEGRGRSILLMPGMAAIVVVFLAMGAIFGATDVSTVAFAEEAGHKSVAGIILAVFAAGSMISGLAYGARHWVRPLWVRFGIGMVAIAAGVSLFVVVGSLAALAAVMFVTGFAIAPTLINGNGLVQELVPAARLTEGLTWVGTALGIGVSVGSSIAGARIDATGSHGGFVVVLAAAGCAVVATLASLRTLRTQHARALAVTASVV
ncbi:MFS transporter [Cellulomonas composti]|uniref:MFS transporter n=1 Tax=Cellulomonas composti TaxID=266130 RepID=A0A511JEK5_9CELL|nr:MFS transporter [Cellulomonas composti]GEL96430.1 MFS transporter [Cellulomonas composti]